MSKRPRKEPPNGQEDIWGDDFTYDEVTSINNIETQASQSQFPVQSDNSIYSDNHSKQKDSQTRDGEIKNLKIKIKQLEIQLSNTKQEKDDKFKTMKKIIDCKDTELNFQQQELTALKNKIKEISINVSKTVPQKNVSFSCMKTGSNSKLLYNASIASEINIKKSVSTQTCQTMTDKCYQMESIPILVINKPYEKLKTYLYPDLFGNQYDKNDVKNLSTIQDCHLILAKLMVLETSDENQSYLLIKLLFENCKLILDSTIKTLEDSIDNSDFVKREKKLIYNYLNLNESCLKSSSFMFDLQFSHLLECISVLTTISNIVPKIVMNQSDNIFQTFVHFLQIIGAQSRTLEFVSVIKALIKFLKNICDWNWKISKEKQLEIFHIIKEIVFCRPCIDIMQELINLLSKISIYTEITDNLCQLSLNCQLSSILWINMAANKIHYLTNLLKLNCLLILKLSTEIIYSIICPFCLASKTFITSERVITFTTGTCVLRVLCLQLELLRHNNYLITNYLYFVNTLLNCSHIPKWMLKIQNKTCDCTSAFIELIIHFLYIIFNIYEKEKEILDVELLKIVEEIIENSYSIIYRLGKLVEEFRSHISKCKGRYDVIVQKIQKLEFSKSNKFLVKELKKFELKSLTHNQCSSSVSYDVFPIDIPKFTQKSQCQFDEQNKQCRGKVNEIPKNT